jgi:hypothetical protein
MICRIQSVAVTIARLLDSVAVEVGFLAMPQLATLTTRHMTGLRLSSRASAI